MLASPPKLAVRVFVRRGVCFVNAGGLLWLSLVAACAPADPLVPPGSLVIAFEAAPTTLDPRYSTDEKASLLADLLYNGLTRLDEHGEPVMDLAASVQILDRTRYVFHLRPDFSFHDGSPVTAADVKATYESVLDPRTASPKRESLTVVERIDTPDERTVIFTLREPFTPFLDSTGLGILPATELRKHTGNVTVGCGPFRLARFRPGRDLVLVTAHSHPEGPPRLPGLVFKIIPDDTVRALELHRGEVDLVQNAIDPDMIPWLRNQANLEVLSVPGTTFHYLGLNLSDRHLGRKLVRQAIALAIDRDAIIRHLLKGYGTPATGLLSPEHWAYASDVTSYPYDPARARELLDEAGFPDPDGPGPLPRFRLLYKGSMLQARRRFAEVLQEQLARVGIALDIRAYEWGTLYSDIRRGNFQLYALAWVGVSDPDIYYSLFHSKMKPPMGNNRGGYADTEIDRLTEIGRRTADRAQRRDAYIAIQRRLATTLPIVPLWWAPTVVVKTRRLHSFVPQSNGSLRSLKDAWLDPQ
jgi:peptide/nickel transport system substrate-binding protein